jgi:hypothetical protein
MKKNKLPVVTDTAGRELPRVCAKAIRKVLDAPVNIVASSPCDYAIVSCGALGLHLSRRGRTIQNAEFTVTKDNTALEGRRGADGRDAAIAVFLKLLKQKRGSKPVLKPKPNSDEYGFPL